MCSPSSGAGSNKRLAKVLHPVQSDLVVVISDVEGVLQDGRSGDC